MKPEDYIMQMQKKYEKMKIEYAEVGRGQLIKKYEDLEYLMYQIYLLIQDGYKYRKLEGDKSENNSSSK